MPELHGVQRPEDLGFTGPTTATTSGIPNTCRYLQYAAQAHPVGFRAVSLHAPSLHEQLRPHSASRISCRRGLDDLQSQVQAKQTLCMRLQDLAWKGWKAIERALQTKITELQSKVEAKHSAMARQELRWQGIERASRDDLQQELRCTRAAVQGWGLKMTEQLHAFEEKAALQNRQMSCVVNVTRSLQASRDDLRRQLHCAQAALQAKHSALAHKELRWQKIERAANTLQTIAKLQSQVSNARTFRPARGPEIVFHLLWLLLENGTDQASATQFRK
eukprot:s323_g29.t2